MKKIVIIITLVILMFNSCNSLEEDHEIKQAVRDYLKEILHNPKSLEDVEWMIFELYLYKNTEKGIDIDFERTEKIKSKLGKTNCVIFKYKAKNAYGELKQDTFYCYHTNKNIITDEGMKRKILMDYFFFMNPAKIKSIRHGAELFFEKYPELKE